MAVVLAFQLLINSFFLSENKIMTNFETVIQYNGSII